MDLGSSSSSESPRVTVALLLYNAAGEVAGLLESVRLQKRAGFERQASWLRVLFVDDASGDGTAEAVRAALAGLTGADHYRLVAHERNLGLAATLNELFAAAETPFLLTCHLDCRFVGDGYVAGMLELMERHPEAACITGQPTLPPPAELPFAEKLNVVANLMDVVHAAPPAADLEPVGFAEGRCDMFRVEAIRAVGLYDTRLRVSGEDQVLAARLRAKGFSIYKAPRLAYRLSVSGEQDSVAKLLRHQLLFGKTTPYILLAVPGSVSGLVGPQAGSNRTRRALLRLAQLGGTLTIGLAVVALFLSWPGWSWGVPLGVGVAAKLLLQARHARAVRFSAAEWVRFLALQPALDVAFTAGVLQGVAELARGGARPID